MLDNLRKWLLDPLVYCVSPPSPGPLIDAPLHQHFVTSDSVDITGSPTRSRPRAGSLPTTRNILQVLYPPSYSGAPPSPDPPSYSLCDDSLSHFSSATGDANALSHLDPLAREPSLTGVPSQVSSGRVLVEPNPPSIGCATDLLEDIEPLPAYSRFDRHQPCFPTASNVLGPYPPLPVLQPPRR